MWIEVPCPQKTVWCGKLMSNDDVNTKQQLRNSQSTESESSVKDVAWHIWQYAFACAFLLLLLLLWPARKQFLMKLNFCLIEDTKISKYGGTDGQWPFIRWHAQTYVMATNHAEVKSKISQINCEASAFLPGKSLIFWWRTVIFCCCCCCSFFWCSSGRWPLNDLIEYALSVMGTVVANCMYSGDMLSNISHINSLNVGASRGISIRKRRSTAMRYRFSNCSNLCWCICWPISDWPFFAPQFFRINQSALNHMLRMQPTHSVRHKVDFVAACFDNDFRVKLRTQMLLFSLFLQPH